MKKSIIYLILLSFIVFGIAFLSIQTLPFLPALGMMLSILTLLWLYSLYLKDSSIVDIFWGTGGLIFAWWYLYQVGDFNARNLLLASLVTMWGLRLSLYLYVRNHNQPEDPRYQQFRKEGGKHYWWISYLRVFILQGLLLWIISSFFLIAMSVNLDHVDGRIKGLQPFDFVGLGLFIIGFIIEGLSDWQLFNFKQDPINKGKVLDTGFWRYSRHPNYFGETLIWWGFFMFALAHPNGWQYIFAPLFMTFLLLKISGVTMLERGLKTTKPAYTDYIKRTSTFIPWKPKI